MGSTAIPMEAALTRRFSKMTGLVGLSGLNKTARTLAFGTISRRNSSSLGVMSSFKLAVPVVWLPGWARLATRPAPTGSFMIIMTTGNPHNLDHAGCLGRAALARAADEFASTLIPVVQAI